MTGTIYAPLRLALCLLVALVARNAAATGAELSPLPEPPKTAQTILLLQRGGLVIYMRHGLTDTSTQDRVASPDMADCSTQRNLTNAGRQQASEIGKAMKRLRIPIGEVLSSPYCRTRETAELAFGGYRLSKGLVNTINLTTQEKPPIVAELRALLSQPVPPGSNRVLVSHSSTLADSAGIFPKPEGVVLIFKPDSNGGFTHIATLAPADWEEYGAARQ